MIALSTSEKAECARWVKGALAGIYQPQPKQSIWEWAEENLRIPSTENAEYAGQLWSSSLTPWVRTIMEWVRLPGKHEMFISKSSQVGVTMAVIIIIVWHIVHKPVNIGYYIDSEGEARKISRTRLKPWILENRILEAVGEQEDDMSNLTFFFRAMTVYLHGSHSSGAYRNKSLELAILDELDAHPKIEDEGSTADLARGRVKRPRNSKVLGFSTPKMEGGQTWQEYLSGTREKMFVKCPCCDHMQPLVWQQMRLLHCKDLANEWDKEKLLRETYYECEMSCRIEMADKPKLFREFEWRATNKNAKPSKRSLQISDLYSPFVTWGELAVEWVEAQTSIEKLRDFVQTRLGEAFKEKGGDVKEDEVLKLCANYHRGVIPIVPVLVSMTVDVQLATWKWGKVAWSTSGHMYLIDWGECTSEADLLEEFRKPIPGPDGEQYWVQCGLVDEGDGNRTNEVRRFCQPLFPDVWPVKGVAGRNVKGSVWLSSRYLLDGVEMRSYHVSDHKYKSELLFDLIRNAERRAKYGKPGLSFPMAKMVDEKLVEELMNERLEHRIARWGYPEDKWIKKADNDYLDMLKYHLALRDAMWSSVVDEESDDEPSDEDSDGDEDAA